MKPLSFKARSRVVALALALGLVAASNLALPARAADDREVITLPPEVKDGFLAEMRGHMTNLNDIISALAEGDFKQAADIAELRMDFGHRMWRALDQQGLSAEEILAMKARMKAAGKTQGQGQGGGQGGGQGMGGGGHGMGRYMPPDFRAMGRAFHEAAGDFASAARAAGDPPSLADYQSVMDGLQALTANCLGCHEAYRIE